jgi:hypothetical protein
MDVLSMLMSHRMAKRLILFIMTNYFSSRKFENTSYFLFKNDYKEITQVVIEKTRNGYEGYIEGCNYFRTDCTTLKLLKTILNRELIKQNYKL